TVTELAGPAAGLTADCLPTTSGSLGVVNISVTESSGGSGLSDPAGHFCQGQAGKADCVASGAPAPCCTGPGTGSCHNFDGCFGSANVDGARFADAPATCTDIHVGGAPAGPLTNLNVPASATLGAVGCLPSASASSAVLMQLLNNNLGLPGPFVSSS